MPGIKKKLGDKLGYGAQLVICDFCWGHLYVVVWQFGPYEKKHVFGYKNLHFQSFQNNKKKKNIQNFEPDLMVHSEIAQN